MSGMFHTGSRTLQNRFDKQWLADRMDDPLVDEHDRAFIDDPAADPSRPSS